MPLAGLVVDLTHSGGCSGFLWKESGGKRMINKVASTFQVDHRVNCLTNCSLSPICDSYNYRAADKTCQLNTSSVYPS